MGSMQVCETEETYLNPITLSISDNITYDFGESDQKALL